MQTYFPVVRWVKVPHCQTCKRVFISRVHLHMHMVGEKCEYYGGRRWKAFIHLPEPCLLRILEFLPLKSLTAALLSDDRLLMVHGLRRVWGREMLLAKPPCYWIRDHVTSLRLLDMFIYDRNQGRIEHNLAKELRKDEMYGGLFNASVRNVIWSRKAARESCFCILRAVDELDL